MAVLKVTSVSLCFAVFFVQIISSSVISPQSLGQRYPAEQALQPSLSPLGPFPSSHGNTECLCKDLASAIQDVVLAKMRQHSVNCPLYNNIGPIIPNLIPKAGNTVTNSGCDGTMQCQCPVCSKNWQNTLARVLGMNNYGQKYTGTSNFPYGNTNTKIFGAEQGLLGGAQNIYSVQTGASSFDPRSMSMNSLGSLLTRSVPNNPKKYSEVVFISGLNSLNAGLI